MKSWIFIGILIALLGSAAYYYYDTTQQRIEALVKNNAVLVENSKRLEDANNTNLKTIDQLQQSYVIIQEQFTKTQQEFQLIRLQNSELKERLGRHELDVLAAAKPVLVERAINNASSNVMRCFELMSGSPLTKEESAAQTGSQFNPECPWLFEERGLK